MKIFKNKVFIFFVGIIFSLVSFAAEKKLVEKSNSLAVLELKQHTLLRMWEYVVLNYIFAGLPVKLKNPELASAEKYYSLPANKKNSLMAEKSKFQRRETLIALKPLIKIAAEYTKLTKEVKSSQEQAKDINLIKS